jgi:hypothetical protein
VKPGTGIPKTDLETAVQTSLGKADTALQALPARTTVTYTTASLANATQESGLVALSQGYQILKIQLDRSARVRLYGTTSDRTADASRAAGTDPSSTAGVMLDFSSVTGAGTWELNPIDGVFYGSGSSVPILIDNLSGSTSTVAVTLTWKQTE